MLAADELTYLESRHMSAPPRLQDYSTRGTKSTAQRGTLCRNQLTQSRRAEISPSSCETPLAIVAISSLSVGEDGPLGVAVALADGQEVTFDGNGAVENVVGSGGQPELQRVRWKWCVRLELVMLEFKVDVCADVVLVARPVVLVGELELPEEGEEEADEEFDNMVVLEGAEVSIELAAVAVFEREVMVIDVMDVEELVGREVNELVEKKLETPVDNALMLLVAKELPVLVGTTEVPVKFADPFEDVDEVLVRKADVEFIFVRRDGDTVVSGVTVELAAVSIKDVWLPELSDLVVVASAEVEFMKVGEQHEDDKGVPQLCITLTTTLVGTVTSVAEAVPPFPSSEELDIIAKLLEDIVIESVPERLVAFAPTDMEPVPKLGGVGIPVPGGPAKNEEMEKFAVLPGIVPIKEALGEGLPPCGVVAGGLPTVELVAPGLKVALLSTAESAAFAEPVAVEEAAAGGGSVVES